MFQDPNSGRDFRLTANSLPKEWQLKAPKGTREKWIGKLVANDVQVVCNL